MGLPSTDVAIIWPESLFLFSLLLFTTIWIVITEQKCYTHHTGTSVRFLPTCASRSGWIVSQRRCRSKGVNEPAPPPHERSLLLARWYIASVVEMLNLMSCTLYFRTPLLCAWKGFSRRIRVRNTNFSLSKKTMVLYLLEKAIMPCRQGQGKKKKPETSYQRQARSDCKHGCHSLFLWDVNESPSLPCLFRSKDS